MVLIDHVCAFVERNQVQWLDLHSRPIKFNLGAILIEVMITIECFSFKEKYVSKQEGRELMETVDSRYYLLAIFDAIMNTMAKANGKKVRYCHFVQLSYDVMSILLIFYLATKKQYHNIFNHIASQTWMCKSMGMSQFHDLLLSFYGKDQ